MTRTTALALIISSAAASAATPVLSGLYQVGELGLVDFQVSDGKVIGRLKAPAHCVIPADTQVVSGVFEGTVFVGTVSLCQEGPPTCTPQRTYPFLGVMHADELAAFIHLDAGCTSQALENKMLFFRQASLEDKQKLLGDTSASSIANKEKQRDLLRVKAAEAVAQGNRLLRDQRYDQAHEKFREAIQADDTMWEGLLGYASTEIKLGHAQQALGYLDKAFAGAMSARASPGELAQIHYNRACAQAALGQNREAVAALRSAVKMAGAAALVDDLATDADLNKLRSDREFVALLSETKAAAKKKPQR